MDDARQFKVGDILIPNEIIYNERGGIHHVGVVDWCDHKHKYQIVSIGGNSSAYELKGITNGRSRFYLTKAFTELNYTIEDDKCGKCINDCRSKEGKCPFYQEEK